MKTNIVMKCPLCPRFLKSQKCVLSHIVRRHWLPVDLLPGTFKTRRRARSIGNTILAIEAAPPAPPAAEPPQALAPPQQIDHLVVFEDPQPQGYELMVVAAPPPPPPPPPPMDLVVYDENRAMRLPLKKRMVLILQMHHHRLYICHKCGKSYTKPSALGGHKAQHTLAEKRKERQLEMERQRNRANAGQARSEEQLVQVHVPDQQPRHPRRNNGPYKCQGCGREFETGQGLGGHKNHCKGPQNPRNLAGPAAAVV